MPWVKTPTDHTGLGYLSLLNHPNGESHFGIWNLILQLAANCSPRGVLITDAGRPMGPREIALKTRARLELIEEAIPRLLDIGWLGKQARCKQVASKVAENEDKPARQEERRGEQEERRGDSDARKRARNAFQPPAVGEVEAYCRERANEIDAGRFVDYYATRGWKLGKAAMKDWKAAVRTWERNDKDRASTTAQDFTSEEPTQEGLEEALRIERELGAKP